MQTKHKMRRPLMMGAPSYPGTRNIDPELGLIPDDEIRHIQIYLRDIRDGARYSPHMLSLVKHPYLRKKLLEAICLRQANQPS